MIIDFHTHYYPDKIAEKTIQKLVGVSHLKNFTDGSLSGLLDSMRTSGTDKSVTLMVATSEGQVPKLNEGIIKNLENLEGQGIIPFGAIHPDYENYKTQLKFLKDNGIKGIKIHPPYQGVDISDIRFLRIISCAEELSLITITHSGLDIGLPDAPLSSVPSILKVIKELDPKRFVLAHMGGWHEWELVEKYLCGCDAYLDLSTALGDIFWADGMEPVGIINSDNGRFEPFKMLDPEMFTRLIKKHGIKKCLYATDSPWASQSEYMRLIDELSFTDEEKSRIFSENACELLNIR